MDNINLSVELKKTKKSNGGIYEKNKTSIYNYRNKNIDKYRNYQKNYILKRYYWNRIQREFFDILINDN